MSKRLKKWRMNVASERYLLNENMPEPESEISSNGFSEESEPSIENNSLVDTSIDSFSDDCSTDSDSVDDRFDNVLQYIASDASDSGSDEEEDPITSKLASWACRNDITRTALNELLQILRNHGHLNLPKDARTVLKTPRSVKVLNKAGGDYVYLGIEAGILRTLSDFSPPNNMNPIKLLINADGVPIFKSTSMQIWLILGQCENRSPFIISLFSGISKPNSVSDFLSDFLHEYTHLENTGFVFGPNNITVKINAMLCDAPARQFLKGVKGHTGYFGCERCQVAGESKQTPLINSSVQCIRDFPLDYMHLVCLGVMKRLLCFIKEGPRICRLSAVLINRISAKLEQFKGRMPSEMARQPRSLLELKRWKATEFRQFILYTGPVALYDILAEEQLIHFRSLHVAMRIMLSSDDVHRTHNLNYAKDLLLYFVTNSELFYGATFINYNVHNLIHLHEDVQYFNTNLDNISCFTFEKYLQVVKKFVRKSQNPICQIVKRVSELEKASQKEFHKTIKAKISSNQKDCWFLVSGNLVYVKHDNGNKSYRCDIIKKRHLESYFEEPCDSKLVGTFFVRHINMVFKSKLIQLCEFNQKVACMEVKDGFVFTTLLTKPQWS